MKYVYVLQHASEGPKKVENIKLIGVYSKRIEAENAIERLSGKPGFSQMLGGFYIDQYEINKDHWEDGFVA